MSEYLCHVKYEDWKAGSIGGIVPTFHEDDLISVHIDDNITDSYKIKEAIDNTISDKLGELCTSIHVIGRRKILNTAHQYTFKKNTWSNDDKRLRIFAIKDGVNELVVDRPCDNKEDIEGLVNTIGYKC